MLLCVLLKLYLSNLKEKDFIFHRVNFDIAPYTYGFKSRVQLLDIGPFFIASFLSSYSQIFCILNCGF